MTSVRQPRTPQFVAQAARPASLACQVTAHKSCKGHNADGQKCPCDCHLSPSQRAYRDRKQGRPRASNRVAKQEPRPDDVARDEPGPERATFPPGAMTVIHAADLGTLALLCRNLETGEEAIVITTAIKRRAAKAMADAARPAPARTGRLRRTGSV